MANYNPKQKRDQRGRWQKRTFLEKAFTRFFPGNKKAEKPVAPYSTAGDDNTQERPDSTAGEHFIYDFLRHYVRHAGQRYKALEQMGGVQ